MNYLKKICKVFFATTFAFHCLSCTGQLSDSIWVRNLKNTLKSGNINAIKSFFDYNFGVEEFESWKYELTRGFLNFNESSLICLDSDCVLMHIPTNNTAYDGDNHDEYFDFIYRIYKVEKRGEKFYLLKRVMDNYLPDLLNYNLNINVDTVNKAYLFDCKISLNPNSHHLLLKLAKEFEILGLQINGKKANYDRFGYFLHIHTNIVGIQHLNIQGRLKSPKTNNQFISMNDKSFFIRLGGFAAIPSPPPNNTGRYFFSKDSTLFKITYNYPCNYTLLQYGDSLETSIKNGRKELKITIKGNWMDDIAFYAQNDWDKKEIKHGNTSIGFFFTKNDKKESDFIIAEVDTLLKWLNKKFNNYGTFRMNFVVLDNFVKGGLLNDSHSIIAQNAEIIGREGIGYLHEISHCAPQPSVTGNYLWIKEGFTNFLSYEYLSSQKKDKRLWEDLKRQYIHYFDLYEEPLIKIQSTSIPTYWAAYSKASWIFRILEAEMGEDNFQKALYKLGTMEGIELKDNRAYMEIFEQVSGKNLVEFEKQWLYRKENPVLTVQGQFMKETSNCKVKIKVIQNSPYFTLPLEIEIKTENKIYRETIQVQGKETVFEKQVNGQGGSIIYDPDSRLFAIIKDFKKNFTEGLCDFIIPTDTAIFASDDGDKKIQVWFSNTKNRVKLFKRNENHLSVLELSSKLSPISYTVDRDTIFMQDIDEKTIQFKKRCFDIAEPIYPKEFIPFLFSLVDWNGTNELSLLYLVPEELSCNVVHCGLEKKSKIGFEVFLQETLSNKKINIRIRNGFPESFYSLDEVVYTRMLN